MRRGHDDGEFSFVRPGPWLYSIPVFLLAGLLILWLIWPSPIDPVRWREPDPPAMTGVLAPNNALADAEVIADGNLRYVSDSAVAADGQIYAGTIMGEILRLDRAEDGSWTSSLVSRATDRHIFGLEWIDERTLGIAGVDGLFAMDPRTGQTETLSTGSTAYPFGFINDLAVGPDGTVYFTDSSTRWNRHAFNGTYFVEMFENRPFGLVYAWDPETRRTRVIAEDLYYPNGITLAADGRSLFVAETFRYAVRRIWLDGSREDPVETFAENLPGFPDGLTADDHGNLFIAMSNPRWSLLTFAHRQPFFAHQVMKLPTALFPTDDRTEGFLLRLSAHDGEILESYQSTDGSLGNLAHLSHHPDGRLCFGTSYGEYLACLHLDTNPPAAPRQLPGDDEGSANEDADDREIATGP